MLVNNVPNKKSVISKPISIFYKKLKEQLDEKNFSILSIYQYLNMIYLINLDNYENNKPLDKKIREYLNESNYIFIIQPNDLCKSFQVEPNFDTCCINTTQFEYSQLNKFTHMTLGDLARDHMLNLDFYFDFQEVVKPKFECDLLQIKKLINL
jgi:hypothetical protein